MTEPKPEALFNSSHEYLDDIAGSLIAAPFGDGVAGYERLHLRDAHFYACRRLGVDHVEHMREAEALNRVKDESRRTSTNKPVELGLEVPPFSVYLVGELFDALIELGSCAWLILQKPWEDIDTTERDWVAMVALQATTYAMGILGAPVRHEVMVEVITRGVLIAAIDGGADAGNVLERHISPRVSKALECVAHPMRVVRAPEAVPGPTGDEEW